ncbi:MAG TPA: hypothetical protein VNJ47_03165 [Nevskiales bacterium]|nr:hypothetical protein [Nevskiales bacterium]
MHRVDTSTAIPALPANEPAGAPGYFSKGDPGLGQSATVPGKDWFNAVQEEIVHVILQAGLVLDKALHTQLFSAIVKHIVARVAGFVLYDAAPEYIAATQFRVPGNKTGDFRVNRRVKVTDLTTFGERITASSYDGVADKTLVTITNQNGALTNALAAVALGIGDPHKPIDALEVAGHKPVIQSVYSEIATRTVYNSAPRIGYIGTGTGTAPGTFTSDRGAQISQISITPRLGNSKIRITAKVYVNEVTNTDNSTAVAVFKDADVNPTAVEYGPDYLVGAMGVRQALYLQREIASPGAGVAVDFKFRAALSLENNSTANTTLVVSGAGSGGRTDDIPGLISTFLVEEIAPLT